MAASVYIYTGKNTVDLFTPSLRQKLASKVSNEVINYYSNIRPELVVSSRTDEIKALIEFVIVGCMVSGIGLNNILSRIGKRNVLFVTNYNDTDHESFTIQHEDVSNPKSQKSDIQRIFSPIIYGYTNGDCAVNFTGTFPSGHVSIVKHLYGAFNTPVEPCNQLYELGMTDWTMNTPVEKYDAVILCGIPNPSDDIHNVADIKSTFAPYCTDDFILIDMYQSDETRLEVAKLWPTNDPDELKRIGLERPQRIEGDKLDYSEEYNSINSYSLFSEELDEATISFNRISEFIFKYFVDIY